MVRIQKKGLVVLMLVFLAIAGIASGGLESVTVASFADPSEGSAMPLFTIDYNNGSVEGQWLGEGLTLEVPIVDMVYTNATFEMTDLTFADSSSGGFYTDGGGSIQFFDDLKQEVMKIEFDRLWVQGRNSGLNGQDLYADNVIITGAGFGELSDEQFGLAFANVFDDGGVVEATASFTSSAVPEPATLVLLAIGGLVLKRRQ